MMSFLLIFLFVVLMIMSAFLQAEDNPSAVLFCSVRFGFVGDTPCQVSEWP